MKEAAPALRVGVLALQGDYAAHADALRRAAVDERLEVAVDEVRRPADLEGLDGLVMPGGESTTLLKLLEPEELGLAIRRFVQERSGSVLATCAGAILVSRSVSGPAQPSLGLLHASIRRNAYGRQVDSFIAQLPTEAGSGLGAEPLEGVFIRAPRFGELGRGVAVLARVDGEPALVREGRVLAATFHPELTRDTRVHRLWLRGLAR